ncbi:hypothetical protein BpHYR1_036500 [Brachionus plicatilis]|uniref:Uncharacterized protein n=1 Tax=Brachionus plicatilis TaxID=10195 RepID=A0A3M7RNL5_BRAPC|nr:hypothetical protein BpHYR1_036500 [Brachionus plicatilis]
MCCCFCLDLDRLPFQYLACKHKLQLLLVNKSKLQWREERRSILFTINNLKHLTFGREIKIALNN